MTRYEKSMLGVVVVGFSIVIWFQMQILNDTDGLSYDLDAVSFNQKQDLILALDDMMNSLADECSRR